MPPAAILVPLIAGGIAGGVGSGLSQAAANKGVRPVNPGLNATATAGLSGAAGPSFEQLLSMIKTGNPVDTSGVEQGLQATNTLQTNQGLATIKEQFGVSGLSKSSPAAVGTGNFLANQNANFLQTIANLRYQSATDATNRSLSSTEFLLSSLFGPAFTEQGPKGSVVGAAVQGGLNDSLSTLAILNMLNKNS